MVTDEQVRRLRKLSNTETNQEIAASKAGCLNVFGMAATVDGAYSGFLGKAGTETLPDLQVR